MMRGMFNCIFRILYQEGANGWVTTTDLKIKTGLSILLFLDSDFEANCFEINLASQHGCQRNYVACILC